MRSAVLGVLLLLVAVATAQTLFAPHRPDLYRGEIGTGFSGDALILTFTEETIYSLPFDVPQGIGEEFELRDIQPPDVECNYPETQCFDHITLDWNPFGHPENGWFQPHFDFHIYMIPDSIRLSMHCEGFPPCLPGPGKEEFFMEPPEENVPDDWLFDVLSAVPQMGTHSYSLNDPVAFDPAYLPHQPVYEPWDDISWVYGFYNETMNFYEAMISLHTILQRRESMCTDIPQPKIYPISAYFPRNACLEYSDGTWSFILGGLIYVEKGQTPEDALENPRTPPEREVTKIRFSDAEADGVGSTIADRVYHQWVQSYWVNEKKQINYDSGGRQNALEAILNQESDFGTVDSFLTIDDYGRAGDLAIYPVVAGSVVPFYNIEGIDRESGSLTMSRDLLARVFLRNITRWNDPEIVAANPGLKVLLPDEEITIVYRQDISSGTTYVFTDALSKFNEEWATRFGASDQWPAALGQAEPDYYIGADGDQGVFATVRARRNSIGYVGYNLLVNGFLRARYVRLINKAGERVTGDASHVESATAQALFDFNFYASLADTDAFDGWPISSFSYLLVRKRYPRDCTRLAAALDFYATSMTRRTSREMTVRLGLSNVALQVRNVVFGEWDQIQCEGNRVFDSSQFAIEASPTVEAETAPSNFESFNPPNTPPFWDSQGSPIDNRASRQYLPVTSRLYFSDGGDSAATRSTSPSVFLMTLAAILVVCLSGMF